MAFSHHNLIKQAIKLREKYTINELLNKYNCIVDYTDIDTSIRGYTTNIYNNYNLIVINSYLDNQEKEFVLVHELAHIILHDKISRTFFYNIKTNSFETEANLFAVVFLGYSYNETIKHNIQKIINNVYTTYLVNNKLYLKYFNNHLLDEYYIN